MIGVQAPCYQIRVEGHLDACWQDRLEALSLQQETGGTTLLVVVPRDPAALTALIRRINDAGMSLVSVVRTTHP